MPDTRPPLYEDWDERYEIVRKIGAGGFADVFEAYDHKLGRPVALKIVAEQRGMSARVVREVEAASALSHPGIVALYDYFSDGERSFLVWELIDGESLDAVADELDDASAVQALAEVLDALVFAHSQGVIHRDIKPQNIMLDDDGRAKVMDFGIARLIDAETLTAEGDVLGTFAYMSPEQAEGGAPVRRATSIRRRSSCTSCSPATIRCAATPRRRRSPTWSPPGSRRSRRSAATCRAS